MIKPLATPLFTSSEGSDDSEDMDDLIRVCAVCHDKHALGNGR